MTDNAPAVVSIRGVDKQFSVGSGSTTALSGIDLTVARGEFVSLIGPSGCGKSTLLRLIGDLTSPTAGTVEVNGKPAHQARLGREYGIVLSGRLGVQLGFEVFELGPEDSIGFDSTQPHRLWNLGDEPVHGIWFVVGREG